jgi:hypothetical protein
VQRSYSVGIVTGVFVGVLFGGVAVQWTTRWLPSSSRDASGRPDSFGEDQVEAVIAEVSDAPSTLTWTSFDRSLPVARGEWRPDELERLQVRTSDLEAELGRMRAALDGKDPKRQRIASLVAVNDLKHGDLYREVAETVLIDPESVTDDPTAAFALLVRLADETGLASAPAENHQRELSPEPNAPELYLSLGYGEEETTEWIRFSCCLNLPNVPQTWRGNPLDLRVVLDLQRSANGRAFVIFSARGNSFENRTGLEWSESWSPDATLIQRSPWNGGKDDRQGCPDEFGANRVVVDDLFEKLKSRAR